MNTVLRSVLGLAAGLGLVSAAAAQDLTAAARAACTPDRVMRCESADKCTTEPASARDKSEVLIIDFAAKTASVRRDGNTKTFAEVIDEGVQDGQRRFALAEGGKRNAMKLGGTISRDGRLTLSIDRNGSKAEAICVAG